MSLKLVASLAALVALAACESTEETRSGMHDWPNPSATVEGPVPGSADHFKKSTQDRVFFDLNKSNITAENQAVLEKQAAWAKEYPSVNFIVEGHCDERGTTEYNLALGDKRAHSAKKGLVASGVDASRIEGISYGKERPAVQGTEEGSWAQNRRAVTVVR